MEFAARYQDGLVADVFDVTCRLAGAPAEIVIADAATGAERDRWPAAGVFPLYARPDELRIGVAGRPYGARLALALAPDIAAARQALPALALRQQQDRGRQLRLMGLATAALVSVVTAYLYGVPLLADRLVQLVPLQWEERLGETAAIQIEDSLSDGKGIDICDANPDSLANSAIAHFATAALAGVGSPFTPDVKVVRTDIPNAFALPGGHAYYFSALLDASESPDEFAGVLAHELGHVYYRHGMQQLIATSATGLLIGFILGDMTGLSVAGGIGAALIDTRFSRDAERQADAFAAAVARRMAFQPSALANLLERVAKDDDFSKALALFSTHPLTDDRRKALEALTVTNPDLKPAFSADEWHAIKFMCGGPKPQSKPTS